MKTKYKGLSVIIRSQYEFETIKEFLGEYLYLYFVPQMLEVETAIVIYYDNDDYFSIGSVGSSEYQSKCGFRLVEFNEFFK